jgi:hypothetical protein
LLKAYSYDGKITRQGTQDQPVAVIVRDINTTFFKNIQAVKEYPLFFWVMISEGFIKSRGEIFV